MKRAPDLFCLLILLVAVCLYHGEALLGEGCFFWLDMAPQDVPNRFDNREALRRGELPLWTPRLGCGTPLYADGQSGLFYPPNWLLCLSPYLWWFNLTVVLHVYLAGAGTYAFARVLGVARGGALIAGLAISFSPLFNAEFGAANWVQGAAWLPIAAALFRRGAARRRARWGYLSGLALGVQFLAGHPYASWMTLLLALFLTLEACTRRRHAVVRIRLTLAQLVRCGAIAAGIAAVQLLPMVQLARQSERLKLSREEILVSGMTAVSYRTVLSPNYFGTARTSLTYAREHMEQKLFFGIVTLVLIPFGFAARPRRVGVLLLLVGVFGALAGHAGKWDLLPRLLASVPPTNLFRHRVVYLTLTLMAAAVLSGRGLTYLLSLRSEGTAARQARTAWALMGLTAVLLAAGVVRQYAVRDSFLPGAEVYPADAQVGAKKLALVERGRARDLQSLVVFGAAGWLTVAWAVGMRPRGGLLCGAAAAQQAVNVLLFGLPPPVLIGSDFYLR